MSDLQFSVRELKELTDADIDNITDVLLQAFKFDDWRLTLTGDPEMSVPFMRMQVLAASDGGEVHIAEDTANNIIGVALWFGPGREIFDTPEQREKFLNPVASRLSPDLQKWWETKLIPDFDALTESSLGKDVKRASWHLSALGVKPEYQRKGVAKALITKVAEKADPAGIPLCLEARIDVNVMIYERMGFKVKGQMEFARDGTKHLLRAMLRESPP